MASPPAQTPSLDSVIERLKSFSDLYLAAALVAFLIIMVVPLSPFVLDMMLAVSISISLLVMLTTLYVLKPVEFSVFPMLLLATTLFRLSLNVASTRLILLNGGDDSAAGAIIRAFGKVVVGGNYVVGLVVFIILVTINFVVITKGAGRIAEVAARFTLDAMPGKQMVDRCRPQRRPHQRGAPRGKRRQEIDAGGRLLRRDGRRLEVRPRRRDRRHHHHAHQHHGRHHHRRGSARHEPGRGRRDLHGAHHRRRTGQPDPGPGRQLRGRHAGHAGRRALRRRQ